MALLYCNHVLYKGKTFTVRVQNFHSWENFCASMLVDLLSIDKAIIRGKNLRLSEKLQKFSPSNILLYMVCWYSSTINIQNIKFNKKE